MYSILKANFRSFSYKVRYVLFTLSNDELSCSRVAVSNARPLSDTETNSVLGRPFHRRTSALERFCRVLRTPAMSRVNTGVHTRGNPLYKGSAPRPSSLSPPRNNKRWTVSRHQPTRSWFPCSSGVTCLRRISTVTFYRFLRSPPTGIHDENC